MRHRLWLLAFPMWTKPLCRGWVGRGISRFPPKKLLHMPGSSTTLGRPDARADASDHVAFRLRNSVGAQDANLYEAQRLAYALPYRRFAVALADDRARLRVDADRYSSCRTCTDYSLPVSPAHCEKLWTLPQLLVVSRIFRTFSQATASVCVTCG